MSRIADASYPYIRQLRALRRREERERTGTYYIEGNRIVAQAVRAGVPIERGVIAPELLVDDYAVEVVAALRNRGVPIVEVSRAAFGSIAFKENLQGIGAVVHSHVEGIEAIQITEGRNWVALDAVGNPGNLGAILRTCDAVGCAGAVLLGNTTDPFHPAAVRASMGALFRQRLVRASFDEFTCWKHAHPFPVVGTSSTATCEVREVIFPQPSVLLMGSERLGLSSAHQAICDLLVRIPMVGTSDSLNLAVATSVVLYEIFHQQRGLVPQTLHQ